MENLPALGDRLGAGRYRLDALIGRGGFGAVYAARDLSLNRDVAVKVLHRTGAEDDGVAFARFLREAQTTAALDCEHLATIHEVGIHQDGAAFIVMERLKGADLSRQLAQRGRIPVDEAVDWILQAALGLAHAHATGIVHRDLKPQNLFLVARTDGTSLLKILDFGIAKSGAAGGCANESLTQTGTLLGTPRYMAPEQIRSGRDVDARADIWALGVVLYELTTGSPIFDAEGSAAFAGQILVDPHIPLRTRAPDLPAALEAVIDRCLAKDVTQRIPDLVELARALAPFASAASTSLPRRIETVLRASALNSTVRAPLQQPAFAAAADTTIDDAATTNDRGLGALPGPPKIGAGTTMSLGGANVEKNVTPHSNGNSDGGAGVGVDVGLLQSRSKTRTRTHAIALGIVLGLVICTALWIAKSRNSSGSSSHHDQPIIQSTAEQDARIAVAAATPQASASPPEAIGATSVAAIASAPASSPAPRASIIAKATATARTAVVKDHHPEPPQSEAEKILQQCQYSSNAPTFLVEGNDGPATLQYQRLAGLGCTGIKSRCATVPITDDEKVRCRDFLGRLKSSETCP